MTCDWTTPEEVRAQLERQWNLGRILVAALSAEPLYPLVLRLRRPKNRELLERFDEARTWIRALEQESKSVRGYGYEISWEELNLQKLGRNRVPASIVVPSEMDALRLLGKERQLKTFRALADATLDQFPSLRSWIIKRPLKILEHAGDWPRTLAVLSWFRAHPRSGLYLRQLDIPGVDTKFIETRKGLLGELLDLVLSPEVIDLGRVGARSFEERYGFRTKPALVRFRILDPALQIAGMSDIATPAAEFAELSLPVERVFITENDINGLAFPDVPRSLVIFGLGYGLERLVEVGWLAEKRVLYWGDLDTHGFSMLERLRARLPRAESLLMDRETLLAHRELWVHEEARAVFEPNHLVPTERALYDDLLHDRLGRAVRLEQERVGFRWLESALKERVSWEGGRARRKMS